MKEESKKQYWKGIGRRKTARSVVKIFQGKGNNFLVNGKKLEEYFKEIYLQKIVREPLDVLNKRDTFDVVALVRGGGVSSQAEAIRLGLARALVSFNEEFRKKLKKLGFLKRDPREKERKKPGLKRARRAPQWQKR